MYSFFLLASLVAVIEAKKEDLIGGLGQCAATMVGIRVFNERYGAKLPAIYGSVSSGSNWRFLKLEESRLFLDPREYFVREIDTLLGILVQIMSSVESPDRTGQQAA